MNEKTQIIINQQIPDIDLKGILAVATLDTKKVRIDHEFNTTEITGHELSLTVEQATEYLAQLKTNERKSKTIIETVLSPFTDAKRWLETSRKAHETEATEIMLPNKIAQEVITSQLLVINRKQKEIADKAKQAVLDAIQKKADDEKAENDKLKEQAKNIKELADFKLATSAEVLQAEALSAMQTKNLATVEAVYQKVENTAVEIKNYSVTDAGSLSTKYTTLPVWECVDIEALLAGLTKILSAEAKEKLVKVLNPSLNYFVKGLYDEMPDKFTGDRVVFGLKLSTRDEIKTNLRK